MTSYLRKRRSCFNQFQSTVSLIFDEIYVYQTIEYSQGRFTGLCDSNGAIATTVLCFVIKSLSGKYSDVIALNALNRLTVEILTHCFISALKVAMDAGFLVAVTVCDNHKVNRQGFRFVLLGHLQSDQLEHRFGSYRQMSGSDYFISVKQVLESEK